MQKQTLTASKARQMERDARTFALRQLREDRQAQRDRAVQDRADRATRRDWLGGLQGR